MKKSILYLGTILISLALSSCGLFTGGSGTDLNGTAWTLESYGGESLISDTTMTANFESGEVSGSASCNHYFGSYQIKGDQITMEGLGWTEMACMDPEGIMEQEQAIMSLLSSAISYGIEGGKLHLQIESGEELIFSSLDN
jgi:heat shock protein HslJ